MKRKTLPLVLAGTLLLSLLVTAVYAMGPDRPNDTDALSAANALLTAGHVTEAIHIYEQLIDDGAQDAVVFYNLGNAYVQAGDPGRAVSSFERAARLDPRDDAIRHNLAMARQQAGQMGLVIEQRQGPIHVLSGLSQQWLTLDELALLALGTWFLLCLLVLAWRQARPGRAPAGLRVALVLALLLVILSGASLASRVATDSASPVDTAVAEQVALLDAMNASQFVH